MENSISEMQLAVDRCVLFAGWLLVSVLNDERAYVATLTDGVPDGTEPLELYEDLKRGEYDEYLTDMKILYARIYQRFEKYGFYFDGVFYPQTERKRVAELLKDKYPFTASYTNFLTAGE